MKAIRTNICAYAVVLLASLGLATTPSFAGSSDFTGIYGAIHASVNGVGIDGTHTDSNSEKTDGMVGAFVPAGGAEIGFNLPLGDVFFLGVGVTQIAGQADVADGNDFDDVNDFSITVSNLRTWYIQPSVSLWDNSAIYVKIGDADGQFDAYDQEGREICDPFDDCSLNGRTYAIGTTTIATNGLFIKTEAGATQYDDFKILNLPNSGRKNEETTNDDLETAVIEGSPMVAYGSVTIGFKF
jgi:hypothetical protein